MPGSPPYPIDATTESTYDSEPSKEAVLAELPTVPDELPTGSQTAHDHALSD